MNKWAKIALGDLIDIKHGFAFKGEFFQNEPNGNILLTPGNFHIGGGFKSEKFRYYNGEIPEDYVLHGGEIVVTMTDLSKEVDTLGYSAIVPADRHNKYLHNQRIGLVIPQDHSVNLHFIYWLMRSPEYRWHIISSASGSTVSHTSPSRIREFTFDLPTPQEQEAIAGILSALDDKIGLLHRQNQTLEALAQTLFRHWFIDNAQDDWEVVTVRDVAQINRLSIDNHYNCSQIQYLDTGSITEGIIAGFQQFQLHEAPSRARRLVEHNDVIISTVRPNQKHYGIIKNPVPNLVVSTGFCVLTCDKVDPHFLYIFLTLPEMTEYLHVVAEGSTSAYPSLRPSDIADVEFQLPPGKQSDNFSTLSRDFWLKIDQNNLQIHTLEKLRDTLLPKLMSGEVRVLTSKPN